MRHTYISNACTHDRCFECSPKCYVCQEFCSCSCHGPVAVQPLTWVSRVLLPRAVHQIGFNNQGEPVFEIKCTQCGWNYMVARTTSSRRQIVKYLRRRYAEHRATGCGIREKNTPSNEEPT